MVYFEKDKDNIQLTLWGRKGSRDVQIGTTQGDMFSHDTLDISEVDERLDTLEEKGWDVDQARKASKKIKEEVL